MSKINNVRLLLAAVAASVAFIVAEIVIEGLARLFKVDERTLWTERFGPFPEGAGFDAVNLVILFATSLLMMWLYAVLRSHFGPRPGTALVAALFIWLFVLVLWVNFINLGVFTIQIAALSLAFNLLEIPTAALAGAAVYEGRKASAEA